MKLKLLVVSILITISLLLVGCSSDKAIAGQAISIDEEMINESEETVEVQEDTPEVVDEALFKWMSCSDSDGGKEYNINGNIYIEYNYKGNIRSKMINDDCQDSQLTEYFCVDNQLDLVKVNCENGCTNGACNLVEEVATNETE